jgi:cephalosporin-C deacetylase-like acetyl esterase
MAAPTVPTMEQRKNWVNIKIYCPFRLLVRVIKMHELLVILRFPVSDFENLSVYMGPTITRSTCMLGHVVPPAIQFPFCTADKRQDYIDFLRLNAHA